jgi:ABC-2 type transport system ATP-binding protein
MRVLEVEGLSAGYGEHEVIKGVTFGVARSEWFCLLGPNGAGKSTLLHTIAGRIDPQDGEIRIGGDSLTASPRAAKRRLGYACAPDRLPELLTGRQCLEVYALAKELDEIDGDVRSLAADLRFTPYMDRFVDTYSLGTRQKLCVLLALLGDPELVVLDEAFNGLDPGSALVLKRHLEARLAAGRGAVLLATHSLDVVEHYADAAALMLDGRIARHWSCDELEALKSARPGGLESALATASTVAACRRTAEVGPRHDA